MLYTSLSRRQTLAVMPKRQRISTPPWWDEIVKEITENGGHIHRHVAFQPESRSIVCNVEIDAKTLVFRIPNSSILSAPSGSEHYAWILELDKLSNGSKPFNQIPDIMLAYKLASEDSTYLKTLPESSAWNSLPRRWTDEMIQKCLGGSPLVERVKNHKDGVLADYRLLNKHQQGKSAPPFERFDDMLAGVTSRAFAGSNDEIMMIPIVDLCNHSRGKNEKKNLEYKILDDGSVEVSTTVTIKSDESFRLTYGAKGNGQLLLNYGFALKDNLESDGSSNDFLEFCFNGRAVVQLKTGPKDYTYGKFIKILEQTMSQSRSKSAADFEDEDDMNAFLDGADEMGEIDIYSGEGSAEETPDSTQQSEEIENELDLLAKLKTAILQRLEGYSCRGSKLCERLKCQDSSIEYFSSLLLLSEQRCLYFYFHSAKKVECLLQGKVLRKLEDAREFKDLPILEEDISLIDEQTTELAEIYMTIRHGSPF